MPQLLPEQTLGRTGIRVTELGLGTGPFGGFATNPIDDETAQSTLEAAWQAGIRFFDTAPWYGLGMSEHRVGLFLRSKPRNSFILSTKVGRLLRAPEHPDGFVPDSAWSTPLPYEWRFDYRRDGILRSYEDSLQRLGLNRVDLLLIHDLEEGAHGSPEAVAARFDELDGGGGFSALTELRDSGAIGGIGVGLNEAEAVVAFLDRFDIDTVLLAGRYTLLDQSALESAYPACVSRGVAVIAAGVFNSGVLATGPGAAATYEYEPAPSAVAKQVADLAKICEEHDVELAAAAVRFPLLHEAVSAVVVGAADPHEIQQDAAWLSAEIPTELWAALREHAFGAEQAPHVTPR